MTDDVDSPRNVVITGATGGLGAALVAEYAAAGVALLVTGRNVTRLDEVAAKARAAGAEVTTAALDVRDREAIAAALLAFDDAHPVDLLIVNAGVTSGLGADGVDPASRRQIEVNLTGALNTAEPLIPRLISRRAGRIALVSSIAAIRPQPALAAYSASKAGLRAWGVAMRGGAGAAWRCRHGYLPRFHRHAYGCASRGGQTPDSERSRRRRKNQARAVKAPPPDRVSLAASGAGPVRQSLSADAIRLVGAPFRRHHHQRRRGQLIPSRRACPRQFRHWQDKRASVAFLARFQKRFARIAAVMFPGVD